MTNLTQKCSTTSPGNHLFWSQKLNGQGQESQKQCRRGSLHSCECWLLLIRIVFSSVSSADQKFQMHFIEIFGMAYRMAPLPFWNEFV